MEKEVLEILNKYYDELNTKHKKNSKQYRELKKEYGYKDFREYYKPTCNIKNIKEQKLHIKRLIKLIKEC
jgi:hypothetical protein